MAGDGDEDEAEAGAEDGDGDACRWRRTVDKRRCDGIDGVGKAGECECECECASECVQTGYESDGNPIVMSDSVH